VKTENTTIEWIQKSGKDCLKFNFGEILTSSEAEIVIEHWRHAFLFKKGKSIVLIWDCTCMKKYESEARAKWIEALNEMKPQVETIWLISDSPIIRLGASVMGMFSSLAIKSVKSESEIVI
jgi:hypothetical protein